MSTRTWRVEGVTEGHPELGGHGKTFSEVVTADDYISAGRAAIAGRLDSPRITSVFLLAETTK